MAIDLNRLDAIRDNDEALDALEDYTEELIDEFIDSPEGQAYLEAHPEEDEAVGSWIDSLLNFGYVYESVTLPHMTKQTVEAIVTRLFPSKLTLFDPDDADSTIPELIAFWEFLKRSYKHPQATRILTFLKQIQPKFKGIMTDPKNFGIAKSFVTSGMNAGFDMTTEAGIQAFQEQYNQNIQATNEPSRGNSGNFQDLMQSIVTMIQSLPGEAIEEEFGDFRRELHVSLWRNAAERFAISENASSTLTEQTITETEPGTILKDFQALLNFVGEAGIPVSGTHHLIAAKLIAEFNQQLSEPLRIDLKRPVQKSYPPVNGLYLLLRTTGLGQIITKGKKPYLVLNSAVLQLWNQLNPTEKYFTLLEAWLIRARAETLGDSRDPLNAGSKCMDFISRLPAKGQTYCNYGEQQSLNYFPEFHNLALMQLFGLLEIESGKPETGKGWRIKRVKKLPFGDALMSVILQAFVEQGYLWESETNSSLPFADLQPALQPYFPDWQATFTPPGFEFRPGVYLFKVSLGKIWRRLAISSDLTLAHLSGLILDSVDFDSDHLDMFTYKDPMGRSIEISHPYADESPSTDEVRVGDLPLPEGASMTYVFDFGDWWKFTVQLEKIQSEDPRSNYAEILESYGKSPEQYPMWDDGE